MKATYVRVSSVEQNISRQLEGKKGEVYWDKVSCLVAFENRKNAARLSYFTFLKPTSRKGNCDQPYLVGSLPGPYDDWLICMISSQAHQYMEGFDEIVAEEH